MSYNDITLQQMNFYKYNVQGYFDETDWKYIVITIDDKGNLNGILNDDIIKQFNDIDCLPLFVLLQSSNTFYSILGYTLKDSNLSTITYVATVRDIENEENTYNSITLDLINKSWSITITKFNNVNANPQVETSNRLETIEINGIVYYIKNYDADIDKINQELISLQNQILQISNNLQAEIQRATNRENELQNSINSTNQLLTNATFYEKV